MLGTSRESLLTLQKQFASKSANSDSGFAADLLKAASGISAQTPLLVALVDSGQSLDVRQNVVRELFGSQIGSDAIEVLIAATSQRWAEDIDFVEALEVIAADAVFKSNPNEVDRIEAEVFAFGRAVESSSDLQMALTNPAALSASKAAIVSELLKGKVAAGSMLLLEHLAGNLRGRRVDIALRSLSDAAAAARNKVVADVKVATPLVDDQAQRLAAVLSRIAGKEVSLNVIIDASVIGGVSVRLGDEVIDGTVQTRLDQARRALVG
jgi:F-type H+-transporting ATPase subunit delta